MRRVAAAGYLLIFSALALLASSAVCAAAEKDAEPKKDKIDENLLPMPDGFVCDWLLLVGVPYSVNPNAVANPAAEFIFGESAWMPREGYPLKSEKVLATKPIQWQKRSTKTQPLALKPCGSTPQSVSYAVTYLVAPADMDAVFELTCARSSRWLVNGAPGAAAVKLKAGYNAVLIRIADDGGDATLSLRVLDKDRKVNPALKLALASGPEEEERRSRSVLEPDPAFILFPKPTERVSYVLEVMTPQAKEVLNKSLDFILKSQQANGAWSDTLYPDSVGVTALCCLALMAEGNLPRQGPHGKALDKGIEFLLNSFREEGVCASKTVEGYGVMYGHALATLCLLEVCGNIPWHPEIEDRISKALQVITAYQRLDGGWRYELTNTGESDTSVTTTVLWVLGQARKYGFTVPKDHLEKAVRFVEKCGQPDGRFCYRLNGPAGIQPHSGVGTAALYGAGRIDHPLLPPARDLIAFEYQRYSVDDLAARRYLLFGSFFASLALYSSGYEQWRAWYSKMVLVLAKLQKPDGEIYDQANNKVYSTALAAIILQAPYGYLSIYQK